MERVIINFKDEDIEFVNIEGTDIFERGKYFHIYNGNSLVGVILASTIKSIYKSTKRC